MANLSRRCATTLVTMADHRRSVVAWSWLAAGLGLGHAATSGYWALGGTALLDTVGGDIERWGRQRAPALVLALGVVVVVKVAVALAAPVVAGTVTALPQWTGGRTPRALSWTAAVVLVTYGGTFTAGGLLALSGAIDTGDADRRALAWHTFLWDPWFLAWGLALTVTLWRTCPRAGGHAGAVSR